MDKILTISIAAYNVERYIRKTLDSLIDPHTIDMLEIFVVDDGGKDRTLDIAQEYAARYPKSVFPIHKQNGGYGSVINTSMKLATGRYFKQLDGDDWFDVEGLNELVHVLKNTDADMVLTPNIKYFEGSGKTVLRDNASEMPQGIHDIENVVLPQGINMHSVTYRTEILQKMGVSITEHCFYTDTEFVYFPISYVEKIYVSHTPVYYYRIGRSEQSVSYTGMRKHFDDHLTVLNHMKELYRAQDNKEGQHAKWIYSRLQAEIGNQYKFYCALEMNSENFKKLKKFDFECKTDKELYQAACAHSKFMKVMVLSKLSFYPLGCMFLRWKNGS